MPQNKTYQEVTTEDALDLAGYTTSNLPSSPTDNALVVDTSRQILAWWDSDHWEFPTFVQDVLLTKQTVQDTTAETEVWAPSVNESSLLKGRVYQMDLSGKFSTANNSSTFDVNIYIGGTNIAGVTNVGGNASDRPWSTETTFTIVEEGASGTIRAHTRGLFNSESNDVHAGDVTIDTTTSTTIAVKIEWTDSGTNNSATVAQGHLKQMG